MTRLVLTDAGGAFVRVEFFEVATEAATQQAQLESEGYTVTSATGVLEGFNFIVQ